MKVVKKVVEEIVDIAALVKSFFVVDEKEGMIVNPDLSIEFTSEQDATTFLLEVIRFWHDKRKLFCHDACFTWEDEGEKGKKAYIPEDQWIFSFKMPSSCGSCLSGQEIVKAIFGQTFYEMPYVKPVGERGYEFKFVDAKLFSEIGREAYQEKKQAEAEEIRRHQEEKRREHEKAERKRRLLEIDKKFPGAEINDELREKILPHIESELKLISSDVAVCQTRRSDTSGNRGIAYFNGIIVFYKGQNLVREWQWRDKYSYDNDRYDLQIHGIGEVTISDANGLVSVTVEILNRDHGPRTETFRFRQTSSKLEETAA